MHTSTCAGKKEHKQRERKGGGGERERETDIQTGRQTQTNREALYISQTLTGVMKSAEIVQHCHLST